MKKTVLVLLCIFWGASIGALLRAEIVFCFREYSFPLGILAANMLGSFLLGVYYNKKQDKYSCKTIFFATACLGSLTTFSTFIHDIFLIVLINSQKFLSLPPALQEYAAGHAFARLSFFHAFLNLCLNVMLCLLCVYFGKKQRFYA